MMEQHNGNTLKVNEIFYSIAGEGIQVGRPMTFVRLAGCNLRCPFCDTEFDSFEERTIAEIVHEVESHPAEWVCITGGEALIQEIVTLCRALKDAGYRLHIESNGTVSPDPRLFDLIEHWTVSPKQPDISPGFNRITELKYVVGEAFDDSKVPEDRADHVYLQPESSKPEYIAKAIEILRRHPRWRLSYRLHKVLGLQ
jgi:7-carboxy-7-deazaguanine synthase